MYKTDNTYSLEKPAVDEGRIYWEHWVAICWMQGSYCAVIKMVLQRIRVVRRTPGTGCLDTQGARLRGREEGEKEAIPRVARGAGIHRALWKEAKPWRPVLRS